MIQKSMAKIHEKEEKYVPWLKDFHVFCEHRFQQSSDAEESQKFASQFSSPNRCASIADIDSVDGDHSSHASKEHHEFKKSAHKRP